MSDDASARLGLPYMAAGQLQKHITLNEALTRLDVLTQTAVVSATTAAQPATPADGALYILPSGATGVDWAGRPAGALMRAEAGGWLAVEAPDGLLAVVLDSEKVLVRRAGAWGPRLAAEPVTALQNLTRLGVNTEADATNVVAATLVLQRSPQGLVQPGGDNISRVRLCVNAQQGQVLQGRDGSAARSGPQTPARRTSTFSLSSTTASRPSGASTSNQPPASARIIAPAGRPAQSAPVASGGRI